MVIENFGGLHLAVTLILAQNGRIEKVPTAIFLHVTGRPVPLYRSTGVHRLHYRPHHVWEFAGQLHTVRPVSTFLA